MCLYFFDPESKVLAGILCLHVDDLLLGGCGTAYRQTINALRSRFPFRKWKRNQGEFCGSRISQDVLTKEITVSQSTYALKINKVTVRARAQPEDKATPAEIRSLRECNGAVQWLAKESRPDLAVQVSLSQQALSDPRVRHCRQANAIGASSKTTPRVDMAFSSNTTGKITAGDAFRCGFSKCSRVSVTSWLHHIGD